MVKSILRQSWQALEHRWRFALLFSVLATCLLLATYSAPLPLYSSNASFVIGQLPLDSAEIDDEERYFGWVTSEYVAIAVRDWGNGSSFLSELRWRLWLDGYRFELDELDELTRWSVNSNIITIEAEHVDTNVLNAILAGASDAILSFETDDLPHLQRAEAELRPLDTTTLIEQRPETVAAQVSLPLRLILGLMVGPLIAIWLSRRNQQIVSSSMLSTLNLPILGEIPSAN